MNKTIYIHMGLHKTGTTSLQEILSNNTQLLKNQGFYYPISNLFVRNHSIPIYSAFCTYPEKYHMNSTFSKKQLLYRNVKILNEFNEILNKYNNIILSGEDISSLTKDELIHFKCYIQKYGFNIIPIIVIRSPYSWYNSRINYLIRQGNFRNYINYDNNLIEKITKLKKNFNDCNIIFIPYNKQKQHSLGIVGIIMDSLHINYSKFKYLYKRENIAYSNLTIRYKNEQNKTNYNKEIKIWNDTNPFRLTKKELSIVMDKIKIENDYLMNEFGKEFCDIDFPTCD